MEFLVQFRRVKRGIPEVMRTVPLAAPDGVAALIHAKTLGGTRFWPPRTDSLRVMDDGGRTLIDWPVPVATWDLAPSSMAAGRARSYDASQPPSAPLEQSLGKGYAVLTRDHQFDVGQSVAYAHGRKPEVWQAGLEIVACFDPAGGEPQYAIRSPGQHDERTVQEHQMREDLGVPVRSR